MLDAVVEKEDSRQELITKKILDDLRRELLDFSRRNNLVHLNHNSRSRSHIRIVDKLPDQLFQALLAEQSLQFKPLPNPEESIADEQTIEFIDAYKNAQNEDQEYIATIRELGD